MAAREDVRKKIAEMVRLIVEGFHPDRIILFGSHAHNEGGPDSDVDLLVVMPAEGGKREQAIRIGVLLHDIQIPKDIIVTSPEAFEQRRDVVGTIEYPAYHEGEVLYART